MTSLNDIKNQEHRASASLILAGKHAQNNKETYDYSLLLVKRTEHTSYVLNHCVFPGGAFSAAADESVEWLTYMQSCGVTKTELDMLNSKQVSHRPELMTTGQSFTRDISLRLTALRETFEEAGLLLCRSLSSLKNVSNEQPANVYLEPFERSYWQNKVHKDPHQFLELCRKLKVLPDLWALSEWSIWRTPATASRKFDTVYFFAALESCDMPLLLEPNEVVSAHWLHPQDCWESSQQGVLWLPFILLYEVARLINIKSWSKLLQFAVQRSVHGSTLLQPVYYRCDDCLFGVLPGDDLYVKEPNACKETLILSGSISEWNVRAKYYNRYIIYGFHEIVLAMNVKPFDGHLSPAARVNTKLSKL